MRWIRGGFELLGKLFEKIRRFTASIWGEGPSKTRGRVIQVDFQHRPLRRLSQAAQNRSRLPQQRRISYPTAIHAIKV